MAQVENISSPPNGRYPQLNLNTGMSLATVVLLLGFGGWIFTLKGDVSSHTDRLNTAEGSIRELRATADAARDRMYQSQITLEGRLVGIEALLRDVINRLAMSDRDRRGDRPNP